MGQSLNSTENKKQNAWLITGGAGFIGAHVIEQALERVPQDTLVINLDKLTYASNLQNLKSCSQHPRYHFVQGDICDAELLERLFSDYSIQAVFHLAAESHVDNSISGPEAFIQTNILGSFRLLEAAKKSWLLGPHKIHPNFTSAKFVHISTDEVYGTLGQDGYFTETTPYNPNAPYSASKASSDHLVNAYVHTYGLNAVITNCSNNYGPYQHDEKLIPTVIRNAIQQKNIPIYGDGKNVRDWLYVKDHARGIFAAYDKGIKGEKYNLGTNNELQNIQLAQIICQTLNQLSPLASGKSYLDLLHFVTDRPGHDFRYAIDARKAKNDLHWSPEKSFEQGIKETIEWYLAKYKV